MSTSTLWKIIIGFLYFSYAGLIFCTFSFCLSNFAGIHLVNPYLSLLWAMANMLFLGVLDMFFKELKAKEVK